MKAKYNNLSDTFHDYLATPAFVESISGHLLPDKASQGRLPLIVHHMTQIAENLTEEPS